MPSPAEALRSIVDSAVDEARRWITEETRGVFERAQAAARVEAEQAQMNKHELVIRLTELAALLQKELHEAYRGRDGRAGAHDRQRADGSREQRASCATQVRKNASGFGDEKYGSANESTSAKLSRAAKRRRRRRLLSVPSELGPVANAAAGERHSSAVASNDFRCV